MTVETFCMILPLFLFVIIEGKWGLRAGIGASIILTIALGIYFYIRYQEFDTVLLVEGSLLIALGGISYKLKDSRYFRLQPFITGILFAAVVFFYQVTGTPFLIRLLPLAQKLNPAFETLTSGKQYFLEYLAILSWQLGVLLLVHAILCGFAALRWSNRGWIATRLAIYPAMFVLILCNRPM